LSAAVIQLSSSSCNSKLIKLLFSAGKTAGKLRIDSHFLKVLFSLALGFDQILTCEARHCLKTSFIIGFQLSYSAGQICPALLVQHHNSFFLIFNQFS
jgi:hypothetical protein